MSCNNMHVLYTHTYTLRMHVNTHTQTHARTHTHTHTSIHRHRLTHTHTYAYTEHRQAAIPATAWVVPSWPGQHCNQSLDSHWSASVQTKHAFFSLFVYKNNSNTHTHTRYCCKLSEKTFPVQPQFTKPQGFRLALVPNTHTMFTSIFFFPFFFINLLSMHWKQKCKS